MVNYRDANYFHANSGCSYTVGPRGGVRVQMLLYRRNGLTKTWKRSPERYSVPIKHGMYGPYGYVTETNERRWHLDATCPVLRAWENRRKDTVTA